MCDSESFVSFHMVFDEEEASIEWSPFTWLSVDVDGRTPSVWLRLSCFAVFSFFVDFLKILEVPSNSVCSLARQRIEHAGDPPVQAFGVRILMTASRVWRVDIPSSGPFTWWNLLNHVAFPTSRYLYFHFTKMWDPFHLASWKLHLEARRNVTNSDVPYSTKERLWPSFWPGLAGV